MDNSIKKELIPSSAVYDKIIKDITDNERELGEKDITIGEYVQSLQSLLGDLEILASNNPDLSVEDIKNPENSHLSSIVRRILVIISYKTTKILGRESSDGIRECLSRILATKHYNGVIPKYKRNKTGASVYDWIERYVKPLVDIDMVDSIRDMPPYRDSIPEIYTLLSVVRYRKKIRKAISPPK